MDKLPNVTTEPESQPSPATNFQDSIGKLSDALSAFQNCFTELHKHIVSFQTSIDSLLPPIPTNSTIAPQPEQSLESDPSEESESEEEDDEEKEEEAAKSELENLCESMCSGAIRKYIITHLSDKTLREQVPKAFKLSPNPARLALDCVGKLFPPMKTTRDASIFVLECFLLMGVDEIEEGVKEEAVRAAVTWRNRMISDGGLLKAHEMDVRGLLLLIGCFGIPGEFSIEDIRDLVRVSNLEAISDVIKRSNVLRSKIPEIIEGMLKDKMEVHAVDIAYAFGVEDRFNPPEHLKTFVRRIKKAGKQSEGSLVAQNAAKRNQLSDLQSVIKCAKRNNINPSKLVRGISINEEIVNLEIGIAQLDKQIGEQMAKKRKIDETESSRRFSNKAVKHSHVPPPWTKQQRVVGPLAGTVGGVAAGRVGAGLSAGMVAVAGPRHENIVGSFAGTMGGFSMDGVGAGISAGMAAVAGPRHEHVVGPLAGNVGGVTSGGVGAGISSGMAAVQQGGSYAGGHGGALVDTKPGQVGSHTAQLYGNYGEEAVHERLASHTYDYRPSVYMKDSTGLPNAMHGDVYRPPPYLEGSTGLSNTMPSDIAGRSSASDIYQVADTVAASYLYRP